MAQEEIGYDKLLPGEAADVDSKQVDDVTHWLQVYTELCNFKEKLLRDIADQREKVSGVGKLEVDSDHLLLQREADRLMRRLRFWQNRLQEVGG
jgi:hypothetical protein